MQSLVHSLLAATLLIHGLFGCCTLYAFDGQTDKGSAVKAPAGSCCHQCDNPDQGQSSKIPGKCKAGCKGVCKYLPTEKIEVSSPSISALCDFAILPEVLTTSTTVATSGTLWRSNPHFEAPLRLHLLSQILLI